MPLQTDQCDRAQALATSPGTARHPGWTLATTILASSLAFIDGSVVNVALPSIGHSLQASTAELQWTVNAYLLPLAALLLLGGAAGDHFGRRRLLIVGIGLFALASAGCAVAPGLAWLLPMRALQGIGAAMLMPNSLALLGNAFSKAERGQAIGTWAAAGAIAAAIGPPLGGWLVDTVGWRAIFFINLPIALAAVVLAWRYVDETADATRGMDWLGAALATAGLGLLTWALTLWSTAKVLDTTSWSLLGGGLLAFIALLAVERRRGDNAMMPLALFGSRAFVGLTVLTVLLYGALGGLIVLLPYTLIDGAGYTPLQAGLSLLPFSVVLGAVSRIAGRFTASVGPRLPLTLGPAIAAAGFGLLAALDPLAGYAQGVLPGLVVLSGGMALAVAPLTTAVLGSVDGQHAGVASGLNSAVARAGGLIATALAGAVMIEHGPELAAAFRWASAIGAALALASATTAFLTLAEAGGGNRR